MRKIIEKIKITNFLDQTKSIEVEVVIDPNIAMVVLPQNIIDELGLRKIREVKVKYPDNKIGLRSVYGVAGLEIKGRMGNFDVLAEVKGSQPLIGRAVLKILDLVIDWRTRMLVVNPRSPDIPMIEVPAVKEESLDIAQDPLFQMEGYESDAPVDLATHVDKYLYGGDYPK
jgi:predicted aspartyl protease